MAIGLTYDNVKDWIGTTANPKSYTDGQGNVWIWSEEYGTYIQEDFVVKDKKPVRTKKKNNTWIIVLVVVIGLAAGALIIKKLF